MDRTVPGTIIAITEDEAYTLHMSKGCTSEYEQNKELQRVGLWHVILTVRRETEENQSSRLPVIHTYYVVAEDKERAINQVSSNPLPDGGSGYAALQEGVVTAEAYRIPFQISGQGCHVF